MARKNYQIKIACPQCGCTELTVLSPEEIKEKYGDVPNFDMECGECMGKYTAEMKTACPEWDQDCKLQEGWNKWPKRRAGMILQVLPV